MKRNFENFEGFCNGWNKHIKNRCGRPITASAVVGTGRCCLIKNKEFGCPNHGKGELVIKKTWIGVKNCKGCVQESLLPFEFGKERGINQIIWQLV